MKKSTKLAMAFMALAGLAAIPAQAADGEGKRFGRGDRAETRLDRADADRSGDLTFEEFSAAFGTRLGASDADGNGQITVEELADEIIRQRAERQARRIISRYDANDDGVLTMEEFEARQRKHFALLDRNDDGVLQQEEMRRGKRGDGQGRHGRRHGGRW